MQVVFCRLWYKKILLFCKNFWERFLSQNCLCPVSILLHCSLLQTILDILSRSSHSLRRQCFRRLRSLCQGCDHFSFHRRNSRPPTGSHQASRPRGHVHWQRRGWSRLSRRVSWDPGQNLFFSGQRWVFHQRMGVLRWGRSKQVFRNDMESINTSSNSDSTYIRNSAEFPPERIWIPRSLKIKIFLSPRWTFSLGHAHSTILQD